MPLSRFEHVLILAKDMAETVGFYTEVLGLEEGHRPPFPFPGHWLYLDDTACVHIAQAAAEANEDQQAYLESRVPTAHGGTGSIDHIAFVATGLGDTVKRLEARGLQLRHRVVPEQGLLQVFIQDPNGITIELNFAAHEAEEAGLAT
jgi:catechol 2,3-dioxygenase-like lactoylglutathione lyase family enzyme